MPCIPCEIFPSWQRKSCNLDNTFGFQRWGTFLKRRELHDKKNLHDRNWAQQFQADSVLCYNQLKDPMGQLVNANEVIEMACDIKLNRELMQGRSQKRHLKITTHLKIKLCVSVIIPRLFHVVCPTKCLLSCGIKLV